MGAKKAFFFSSLVCCWQIISITEPEKIEKGIFIYNLSADSLINQIVKMKEIIMIANPINNFGYDFDITPDSSTLVVSAPNANAYAGKVYVYNHTSSLYELAQTLTSGATNPERYGESVAVTTSGDTIAIGSIIQNVFNTGCWYGAGVGAAVCK